MHKHRWFLGNALSQDDPILSSVNLMRWWAGLGRDDLVAHTPSFRRRKPKGLCNRAFECRLVGATCLRYEGVKNGQRSGVPRGTLMAHLTPENTRFV